jgi:hypothetical protein
MDRIQIRLFTPSLAVAVLLGIACSEDSTSARGDAGTLADGRAADSGFGARDGRFGPDGQSSSSPPSKRFACRAYLTAACERLAECTGPSRLESCLSVLDQCPDYLFSEGSTRSPEATVACAAQWKALPCSKAAVGITPSCSLPGTRRPGDSCRFPTQCASLICTGTANRVCGVCQAVAAPGAPCDGVNTGCPLGQECTGTCSDKTWTPPTTSDAAPPRVPGPGERCSTVCVDGYDCLRGETDTSLFTCRQPPQPGERCAQNLSFSSVCAKGAYCSASPPNTCVAEPKVGEHCRPNATWTCAEGHVCDMRSDAGTYLTCFAERAEGEPCGAPNVVCAPGTECRNSTCVAKDELTLFEKACGG